MKGNIMGHNFTLPEEIDIALMELEESEKKAAKIGTKNKKANVHDGWYAKYIPPYRAAYRDESAIKSKY
jgi:hypothetical protein